MTGGSGSITIALEPVEAGPKLVARLPGLKRGRHARLSVRDNGHGMAPNAPEGVGLSNTRSRLALLYGERHSFDLLPAPGGGLLARIGIPLSAREAS